MRRRTLQPSQPRCVATIVAAVLALLVVSACKSAQKPEHRAPDPNPPRDETTPPPPPQRAAPAQCARPAVVTEPPPHLLAMLPQPASAADRVAAVAAPVGGGGALSGPLLISHFGSWHVAARPEPTTLNAIRLDGSTRVAQRIPPPTIRLRKDEQTLHWTLHTSPRRLVAFANRGDQPPLAFALAPEPDKPAWAPIGTRGLPPDAAYPIALEQTLLAFSSIEPRKGWAFHFARASWQPIPEAPAPDFHPTTLQAALGDTVYFFGSRPIRFDATSNQWTSLPEGAPPEPAAVFVTHASKRLLVISGRTADTHRGPVASIFDADANKWLPIAQYEHELLIGPHLLLWGAVSRHDFNSRGIPWSASNVRVTTRDVGSFIDLR